MWTRPSNEVSRKTQRLPLVRESRYFSSHQPDSRCTLQTWSLEGIKPEKQMLFLHGALSHGGRHAPMLEWFVRHYGGRLQVHALDFVGHGLSSGPRGHVASFSHWVEDLITTLHLLAELGPLTLFCHSMGGLIALKALLENEQRIPKNVGPIILSNPCIRPIQVVEIPRAEYLLNGIADKVPTLRFPRVHKGPQLVNDAEAANAFEADPLIPGFITAQMTREIWYASQSIRPLSYFLKRPTLFLLSDDDSVVDREASLLFSRGIDKKFCKVIEYKNTKHELLHEKNRMQVWRDAADWLENL